MQQCCRYWLVVCQRLHIDSKGRNLQSSGFCGTILSSCCHKFVLPYSAEKPFLLRSSESCFLRWKPFTRHQPHKAVTTDEDIKKKKALMAQKKVLHLLTAHSGCDTPCHSQDDLFMIKYVGHNMAACYWLAACYCTSCSLWALMDSP